MSGSRHVGRPQAQFAAPLIFERGTPAAGILFFRDWPRFPDDFADLGLTTKTGISVLLATEPATLPMRKRLKPSRPWLAIAIKSMPWASANSTMDSAVP